MNEELIQAGPRSADLCILLGDDERMKRIAIGLLVLALFIGFGTVRAEEVTTSLEEMAYPHEFSDTMYTLEMDSADRVLSICSLSYGSYSMNTPHPSHAEFGPNEILAYRLVEMVPGTYSIETQGRGIIQLHDVRLMDALTSGSSLTHSFVVNKTTSFIGSISGRHTKEYKLRVEGAQEWGLYDLCGNKLESVSTGDTFSVIVDVDEPKEVSFIFVEMSTSSAISVMPGLDVLIVVVMLVPLVAYGWYKLVWRRNRPKTEGK